MLTCALSGIVKVRDGSLTALLLVLLLTVRGSPATNTTVEAASLARPRHKLSLLWPLQSVVGLVGVALNSIVFYMFVSERQNMANSVNVLIWYSMVVHLAIEK